MHPFGESDRPLGVKVTLFTRPGNHSATSAPYPSASRPYGSEGKAANVQCSRLRTCSGLLRRRPREAGTPHRLSRKRGKPLPRLRPITVVRRSHKRGMWVLRNCGSTCRDLATGSRATCSSSSKDCGICRSATLSQNGDKRSKLEALGGRVAREFRNSEHL